MTTVQPLATSSAQQRSVASEQAFPTKERLGVVSYSRGTLAEQHAALCAWLRGGRTTSCMIGYVNPHVYNLAKRDSTLQEFLARADLVSVDGLGISAGVLLVNGHWQTRTVMTPLFDRVLATQDLPALRAVLIGGTEGVMTKGAAAINRATRTIKIVAMRNGYQPIAEYLSFLEEQSEAEVVLIAMGTPRSEQLALAAVARFPSKLFWNIGGGTLHFYAGTLSRVPPIVSSLGMQWLWRIVHEPRVAPRYIIGIPVFLASMVCLVISKRNLKTSAL